MIARSTTAVVDRLRRAGTAPDTAPDIASILARAAQRKRRRQIGVTAASVVVIGGLGFGSAQWLSGSSATSISAAGSPDADVAAAPGPAVTESTVPAEPSEPTGDESATSRWTTPPTTAAAAVAGNTTVADAPPSVNAVRRIELADDLGGAIVVDSNRLMHRSADGELTPLELPEAGATTQRTVTDVALLDGRPFMMVSDFTDRPDLAEESTESDAMHQELAIYAVDLTTDDVHVVEQRTITEKHSPLWVYNGHVTTQGSHIMVVRELWQSMCVYVESLDLEGNSVETPENPLPEPSLHGLDSETIRNMQDGIAEPPRGCIAAGELPDGAMSVLGVRADPAALDAVNRQLQSAASLTAQAVSE